MNSPEMPRSGELMSRSDTALLVVDVQEKLLPLIGDQLRMQWNIGRLIEAARLFEMPVAATEQYPQGLGKMIPGLASHLGQEPAEKISFSCRSCSAIFRPWQEQGVFKILLAGIETHVCVLQTALDLLADGFRIYVAVDAVGARHRLDHETALRRMESAGAVLTTTEMALFEWCETAGTAQFKQLNAIVRQQPPSAPPEHPPRSQGS